MSDAGFDLLAACQALHLTRHGAADPLPDAERDALLRAIRERLRTWHASPPFTQRYDDAVLALAIEALREYDDPRRQSR